MIYFGNIFLKENKMFRVYYIINRYSENVDCFERYDEDYLESETVDELMNAVDTFTRKYNSANYYLGSSSYSLRPLPLGRGVASNF